MQSSNPKSYLEQEFEKLDKELADAFDLRTQSRWSKKEWEVYERSVDAVRCFKSQLETAYNRGQSRGEALVIAKQFLDILDAETIAKKTGLSVEQVEELKKRTK